MEGIKYVYKDDNTLDNDLDSLISMCFDAASEELKGNPSFLHQLHCILTGDPFKPSIKGTPLWVHLTDNGRTLEIKNSVDEQFERELINKDKYSEVIISLDERQNMIIRYLNGTAVLLPVDDEQNQEERPRMIFEVFHKFRLFNKYGIEISQSSYSDCCEEEIQTYRQLSEEAYKHCPVEWYISSYPGDLEQGVREYAPVRKIKYRDIKKYGIMNYCKQQKREEDGVVTEKRCKYQCDPNRPEELVAYIDRDSSSAVPFAVYEDKGNNTNKSGEFVAVERAVSECGTDDVPTIEAMMNLKYCKYFMCSNSQDIRNLEKLAPKLYDYIKKSISYGLVVGNESYIREQKPFGKEFKYYKNQQ